VSGGSIGGLFAALALRKAGWDVIVLERTDVELSGRGAGIVTHDILEEALVHVGAGTEALGVAVSERVAYDIAGDRVAAIEFPQVVTSWERIHGILRALMPDGTYRDDVCKAFCCFAPAGTQIIGYPSAGPGNDLRPGHRRFNFVWYSRADAERLDDMLTDETGTRHDVSIPPPLIRETVLARMRREAAAMLPMPFVDILDRSERPFFTPIHDHLAPTFAAGRVALSGDAACAVRPHVGMGVTKAACDALALARHLDGKDVASGLQAYSAERVPAGDVARDRARRLGHYIFDPDGGASRDGRVNPRLDEIMRTTAVTLG